MLLQLTKNRATKKGVDSRSYIFNASYTTDESVLFQGNCLHFQKEKRFIFNDYIIRVHEQKNGKWKKTYEKVIKEQHDVKFITAGLIGKYEHAVVGYKSGSRNFLNSYLIGSTDGEILKTIQTKENIMMGNTKIAKGSPYYLNRSITLSKYSYKKNKLVSTGQPTGQDDRIVAEQPEVWLGLEQLSGRARYVGKPTYTIHVGDRIGIGRNLLTDAKEYEYSLHSKGHYTMDWNFSKVSLLTKKPGTT